MNRFEEVPVLCINKSPISNPINGYSFRIFLFCCFLIRERYPPPLISSLSQHYIYRSLSPFLSINLLITVIPWQLSTDCRQIMCLWKNPFLDQSVLITKWSWHSVRVNLQWNYEEPSRFSSSIAGAMQKEGGSIITVVGNQWEQQQHGKGEGRSGDEE